MTSHIGLVATADFSWSDLLNPATLSIAGVFLFLIVGEVAQALQLAYRDRLQVQLKKEMLDRGMSAEEVALVVNAGSKPTKADEKIKLMKAAKEMHS